MNVIVLLAGRQTALWRQTMDRVRSQLLGGSSSLGECVFIPSMRSGGERYAVKGAYAINEKRAERAFRKRTPIVFVAMKEVNHLASVSRILSNNVFPAAAKCGVDVNLVVIDDEADDASIADDQVKPMVIRSKKSRESRSGFSIFGQIVRCQREPKQSMSILRTSPTRRRPRQTFFRTAKIRWFRETLLRRYAHPVCPECCVPGRSRTMEEM